MVEAAGKDEDQTHEEKHVAAIKTNKVWIYIYIYVCVCADTIIIKHGHFNQQKYSSTIKDVGFTMFQQ